MKKTKKTFAYIDAANLHRGVQDLGWNMDYFRFHSWLKNKYAVDRAYLFIGLIPKHKNLYTMLQEAGFTLVFNETTYDGDGKAKGNCDADLVLHVMRDAYEGEFDGAVIVSGDGDYASLVSFLSEKNKLVVVLAPNSKKCSILLKRTGVPITYLNELKDKLKRKSPRTGKT
ncbi:MAG: NYN domain-containing protein [Candidatus Moraniibacteriota bacterium]